MPRLTNDLAELAPRTSFDGPELRFDLAGLEIGAAEYDEGPTGCTVFSFAGGPVPCSIDVRGGSPAVSGAGIDFVDAICLAGGSLYGLEAAAGVAAERLAQRDYSTDWMQIPLVAGAIIFDWGPRDNAVYPDKELGRAALRAAREGIFPLGCRGAGRSATAGKLFSYDEGEAAGQGGAFRQIGETKVAVFTVVNAVGAIVDREGNVVRGHYDRESGVRRGSRRAPRRRPSGPPAARKHDADRCGDEPGARRARAAHAGPTGARVDGAGDPAVPRARGRRRPVCLLDGRGRDRSAARHDRAGRGRLRARLGCRALGRVKKRLDVLLVERGLVESRAQAQALVLAGLVPGHEKAGEQVDEAAELTVMSPPPYVSRGGEKLAHALDVLRVDPAGLDCLDVGASTGGFTDVLLQRGAARVIALDVGHGQLYPRLRADPRVVVLERTNAREVRELPFAPELVTCDVSFIGVRTALPPAMPTR